MHNDICRQSSGEVDMRRADIDTFNEFRVSKCKIGSEIIPWTQKDQDKKVQALPSFRGELQRSKFSRARVGPGSLSVRPSARMTTVSLQSSASFGSHRCVGFYVGAAGRHAHRGVHRGESKICRFVLK